MGKIESRFRDPKFIESHVKRQESGVILAIPKRDLNKLRMPSLFEFDRDKFGATRFDVVTGEIVMVSWMSTELHPNTLDENEYKILKRRNSNPKRVVVAKLAVISNIEAAARQALHVNDEYESEGARTDKTLRLQAFADELTERFEERGLSTSRLKDISEDIKAQLEALGFANVRKPLKKQVKNQLSGAATKDNIGRVNSVRSRAMTASAGLKIFRETIFNLKTEDKYGKLALALTNERTVERHHMRRAIRLGLRLLSISPRELQFKKILDSLKGSLDMDIIKAAPYRIPAAFASYILGVRGRDFESLISKMIEKHSDLAPIFQSIPQDMTQQINTAVILLQKALREGALNLRPSSDKI